MHAATSSLVWGVSVVPDKILGQKSLPCGLHYDSGAPSLLCQPLEREVGRPRTRQLHPAIEYRIGWVHHPRTASLVVSAEHHQVARFVGAIIETSAILPSHQPDDIVLPVGLRFDQRRL